jgi:hypothetical protein
MLGKLTTFVTYWKCLEVYIIKRFPSTKIPVMGMVVTYLTLYFMYRRWKLSNQIIALQHYRKDNEARLRGNNNSCGGFSNRRNRYNSFADNFYKY